MPRYFSRMRSAWDNCSSRPNPQAIRVCLCRYSAKASANRSASAFAMIVLVNSSARNLLALLNSIIHSAKWQYEQKQKNDFSHKFIRNIRLQYAASRETHVNDG